MTGRTLIAALVVAAGAAQGRADLGSAQERPFWGALEPGPHAVGFRSWWESDHGRVYDTTYQDGTRYAEGKAPRPILVNLWYPAQVADPDAARMVHGDYLELRSADPRLARLSLALADYETDVIVEWAIGAQPDALGEADRAELERLLATPTASVRDAEPEPGPFPLVVYHAGYGSSYEDNAVLCEYLASHGYVVAGSAFLAEGGESFNIDGGDGSARDIAFLIRTLADVPYVDWRHVAVVGHSGGAHAALGFQAEPDAAVDAVISLDTTQDYVSALDPHWLHPEKMLRDVATQTAPLLVVANPHAFFQVCDALVHADRTYLTLRDLDHNDFISQGVMTAEVAAHRARGQGAADAQALEARARVVRRGFEQCCEVERLFLDAHLKGDATAREELARRWRDTPLGGPEPHVEHAAVGEDGPPPYDASSGAPPTPRQVLRLVAAEGGEATRALLERVHAAAPDAPIFESQFAYALLVDLVARGRAEDAAALAPFLHELHPGLVRTLQWWAERGEGQRYRAFRRHALTAACLLEPDDAQLARRLEELERDGR